MCTHVGEGATEYIQRSEDSLLELLSLLPRESWPHVPFPVEPSYWPHSDSYLSPDPVDGVS